MTNKTLIPAALLAAFFAATGLSLAASTGDAVQSARAGRLDTIGIGGGVKKKAPTAERVGIEREAASGAVVLTRKDPLVLLTEPSAGEVAGSVQAIAGNVGSGITKAFLRINDDTRIVPVVDGRFVTSGALRPGLNTITALAWDLEGNLGKTSSRIFYRPKEGGPKPVISSPRDGAVIDITENRVVKVVANTGEKNITEGVLVVNNIPRRVRLEFGALSQELALLPGVNDIFIEVARPDGTTGTSRPVTVRTFDARPKDLVAVLSWNSPTADLDLHVWDSFGHHTSGEARDPYQCDSAIPEGMLDMDRKGGYGPEVFSLEAAEPEVYTFFARYSPGVTADSGADAYLSLLLYGDEPARRIMRVFGPVRLDKSSTSWEAAHVKMPEGVFFQEKDADLVKTLGMDAKAVRRLALMLKEENQSFGLLAITALGQIKSEEAVGPISAALASGTPEIRRAAAGALWDIKSVDSVAALIDALSDPDPDVRRAVAGALGNIGDARAVQGLSVLLSDEGDMLVRVEVIRALGRIGDPKAFDTLVSQVADPDHKVRVEAVRALGGLKGSDRAVASLAGALADSSGRVRELAAWSLGRLGASAASKPLMDVLYFDEEEGVRVQAALALARLGGQDAVRELEKAADKDYSPRVRFCATKAIGQLAPPPDTGRKGPVSYPAVVDDDLVTY